MSARIERLVPQFTKAGRTVPRTANAWQALAEEAVGVRDAYDERREELDALGYPLQERYSAMRREAKDLQADIERKRRSRTRITKEMAEARTMMARAAGLEPEQLPYVAELMDVQGGEEQWRTAMNVVYASLAPIILVDKRYEPGVARAISHIPHASMARRNWQFVDVQEDDQIKAGAHGSHGTKNISQDIGFVTEGYLRDLADELEQLEQEMDRTNQEIERIGARKAELEAQRDLAQAVLGVDWTDIDVQSADAGIAMLHDEIERILADPALAELEARERELASRCCMTKSNASSPTRPSLNSRRASGSARSGSPTRANASRAPRTSLRGRSARAGPRAHGSTRTATNSRRH